MLYWIIILFQALLKIKLITQLSCNHYNLGASYSYILNVICTASDVMYRINCCSFFFGFLFHYLKLSINHTHLCKAFRFNIKQKTKPHNHSDINPMDHWTASFAREANLQWTTFGMYFARVALKKENNIYVSCFHDRT